MEKSLENTKKATYIVRLAISHIFMLLFRHRHTFEQKDSQQSVGAVQLYSGRGRKGEGKRNRQHPHAGQCCSRRTVDTTGFEENDWIYDFVK